MKQTVGLIGAGYWGKNLARNFFEIGALHTICDANLPLLESYREKYPHVKLEQNPDELFNNPQLDQIVIATPAFQHYQMAKKALLAGKDVYVEKPLCMFASEAEELVALAKELGRVLMVGHILHYHPCVKKLQEIVQNGEIGKLQYIVSNRLNLGSYRTEENALWNFAPHDVSVILSLCGGILPEKVRCTGGSYITKGVEDKTLTTLKFEGDLQAHIFVSWLNPFKEQKLTVIGSTGIVVFDDTAPWGEKLTLYRNHVSWGKGNIPQATPPEAEKVDPPQEEPLKQECLHFLQCCKTRETPKTDGEEGLRVLQVLQAAENSLKEDGEAMSPSESTTVHPTATIDPGAKLGKGTKVWHYSHISSRAKIGDNCRIGQNVYVSDDTLLGNNVKIQNNVSVYSGVVCEDDVFLGPSMVFTNILNPRSEFPRRDQYVKTFVKKGATIGANATILCGVTLGEYSFVGAGAVVTKDVPPHALVVGNPARQVGWVSRSGEKLDLPLKATPKKTLKTLCEGTQEEYSLKGGKLEHVGKN